LASTPEVFDGSVAKTFSNAMYRVVSYNSGATDSVSQIFCNTTIKGYEAMHMLRKGQVIGVPKGDVLAQLSFMAQVLGVTA